MPDGIMTTPGQPNWIQAGISLASGATKQKGILALADQAVASANNFLTGIIIARSCTKEEFGLYMLGFSIVLFMIDVQGSLISTPYMVYSPRLKGSEHSLYTGSTLIHQFALSALTMLLLVMGALVIPHRIGPPHLAGVVWTLAGVIAFLMLREYARRVCFAGLRMGTALLVDSSVALIQISALALFARFGQLSASTVYWVVGIACAVPAVGWVISSHDVFTLRLEQAFLDFGRNWSFSKWVFVDSLLWTFGMNLYPWMLAAFRGVASAGVWAACLGIAGLGYPVLSGLQNLFGPKIAHSYAAAGHDGLRQCVLRASAALSIAMVPLFLGLLFFGDRLVTMLYGANYAGNGATVSLLGLNLIFSGVSLGYSGGLFAMERADLNLKVTTVTLFVFFTLGFWLVRSLGPLGAASGLLIANIASSSLRVILFTKFSGSRVCAVTRQGMI